MPSSSSSSCFDFALDYLEWFGTLEAEWNSDTRILRIELGLLKTFYLLCRRRKHDQGNMLFRIKHLVHKQTLDLHSGYLRYFHSLESNRSDIKSDLTRFQENIKLFFETDIKESWIFLLDYYSLRNDGPPIMDIIDALLQNLKDLLLRIYKFPFQGLKCLMQSLQEKLILLKNFIGFATLQGVESNQLTDLLNHVEAVAVDAARLISMCWFDRDDKQVCNEIRVEISQLIHKKINPVDPQVRETYIHVLTASKLSRSQSHTLAREKNKHLVSADFIHYLLYYLMDILESYTSMVRVKDPLQKLLVGVRFLIIIHRQQEKFNELRDEMKDLIEVVVNDTGIVICSLSVNEMKDGLDPETDLLLSHLLKVLEFIAAQIYPLTAPSSFSFPRTNELGSIDFLVQNLKELVISEANSIAFPKGHIHAVLDDLVSLRPILQNIVEQRSQNEKLQSLWNHAMEVAYKAELVIDSILVGDEPEVLDIVAGDIKLMKIEAEELYDSMRHDTEARRVTKNSFHMTSQLSTPALNELVMGLDDEVNTTIDRLTRGSKKLDIVSIVGMPGLGKTTLAKKVYNHPSILCHFHIRAWCCVSHVYSKHSLLVQILCSIDVGSPDEYLKKTEDDLADQLRKRLKRNMYVIVLDDVWHIDAWNLLKLSFPDDANGSRILVTSRSHKLPLQIKIDSELHHLRPLTDEESWALLQSKIFGKEGCPPALSEVGMQIAKKCKGLPLSVVIVAGILASIKQDCWEEVANSLSSSNVIETEYCMKTLDLSYRYLPDYLKPCLLYFGAFREDSDIPVRKLVLLWISEGFVQQPTEATKLEDVAHEYLMDLIDRSLVMVIQQRSVGGIKACRIHDLVHEFCVAKAKEESFLRIAVHASNEICPHRLCIHTNMAEELNKIWRFFPHLRSLLFLGDHVRNFPQRTVYPFIFRIFKLLRVLDLGKCYLGKNFPKEVELLVHLRYLAICCDSKSIPSAIANLSRLETLIIEQFTVLRHVKLPNTIWKMKKLRHLSVEDYAWCGFVLPIDNLEVSPDLSHLDTFTLAIDPSSRSLQTILTKMPSIRTLTCLGPTYLDSTENCNRIIALDFLSRLESLKVREFQGFEFAFPSNLKKLTLEKYGKSWSEISTIGKLPNLKVLKLGIFSFEGEIWEMKEGEFPELVFLQLENLDIVRWTAPCDNFPPLQKLVLRGCYKLEEVPSCLGDIETIEMIVVSYCHRSAVSLVKQIQEQQMDMGNKNLEILIKQEH